MSTPIPSAAALSQELLSGKRDPVALAEEVFARLEATGDPAIFTETLRSRALAEAMASRQRLAAGNPASRLDGVPIAWKDLFDIEGRVTTVGSVVLAGNPPASADAALVAAAGRGGMVTVGCLNMTELAYSGIGLNPHFGTPRNPHGTGPARAPGGSSSACGVVVAAGVVPIAIGTDTGGSIRIPAAFNGVVGYKSSTGHYPMGGVFPLSRSFDTLGPLAQSVADCVLTDAVLRGQPQDGQTRPDITPAPIAGLAIMIPETTVLDGCQPAVLANFEAAIDRLGRAGARITRIKLPELQQILDLVARRGHQQGAEALALHWDRIHGPDAARIDARVVRRISQYASMTAVDLLVFQQERARLIAETNAVIGDALVAFPTTPNVAMPIAPLEADTEAFGRANLATLRNTMLGNFLDWCGVSIPSGSDGDAMPTAFLFNARHGQDRAVLAAALATENLIRG